MKDGNQAQQQERADAAQAMGGEQNVYSFGRILEALRSGAIPPLMAPDNRCDSGPGVTKR